MLPRMARRAHLGFPEHLGAVLLRSTDARAPLPVDAPPVAPRDWELAVGTKIARRARPTKLDRGVLHVRTASSGWTQELSLLADAIVTKLRARGLDVRSLRFHVGSVEPLARPSWRTETRTVRGPAALPPEVKGSLAAVESPDLRDAIARAAAASLGYEIRRPPRRHPRGERSPRRRLPPRRSRPRRRSPRAHPPRPRGRLLRRDQAIQPLDPLHHEALRRTERRLHVPQHREVRAEALRFEALDLAHHRVELVHDRGGQRAREVGVELEDVVDPRGLLHRAAEAHGVARGLLGHARLDGLRVLCAILRAVRDVVQHPLQDALGLLGAAHREGLVGDAPEERKGLDPSGVRGGVGVLRRDRGDVAVEVRLQLGRAHAERLRVATVLLAHLRLRRLVDEVDAQLLAADRDAIVVVHRDRALDLRAVHEHAVAAAEVLDGDAVLADAEGRVLAGHERIIERELALRASSDEKLPDGELDVVCLVSKPVGHPSLAREKITGSRAGQTAGRRASLHGPEPLEAFDTLANESLARSQMVVFLQLVRVGGDQRLVDGLHLAHHGVQIVDESRREQRAQQAIELEDEIHPEPAARRLGQA